MPSAPNQEVAAVAGRLIDCAVSSVAARPLRRSSLLYAHPDGTEEEVSSFEFSAFAYRDRLVGFLGRLANLKGDDSPRPAGFFDAVEDDIRFIADPAGYFWSDTADRIMSLPGHQVRRVARLIHPTITSVARLFVSDIAPLEPHWANVLAQPIDASAWLAGGYASRPDFIARCTSSMDVHVWDLKTSARPLSERTLADLRTRIDAKYAQRLRRLGYRTHVRIIAATQGCEDARLSEPLIREA